MIGSPRAITRAVRNIKKVSEQSSPCIERIQTLEFSRNTRLTSITRRRGKTGERLMPSNSPPRIEIPSKPLGYDALQIVHACVYRVPRIDASLVRHERAGQATCSIALILSFRSTFFFATTVECLVERGNSEAGRATPLSASNRSSSLTKHVRARVFGSPLVFVSPRNLRFLVWTGARVSGPLNTMECRVRESHRGPGLSYTSIYDCVMWDSWMRIGRNERGREVAASVHEEYENVRLAFKRLCFLCASNKTRYSHTGPKLGLPSRPPVVGNLYVSRTLLEHPPRKTSFRDGGSRFSRCRCDSISSLYFDAPTFFNAAAETRRARICHMLNTTRGMVPRRILIGPITYFNPFLREDAIAFSCSVLTRYQPQLSIVRACHRGISKDIGKQKVVSIMKLAPRISFSPAFYSWIIYIFPCKNVYFCIYVVNLIILN